MNMLYNKLKLQLSLEYNCSPKDFDEAENVVTVSAIREGRRIYSPEKYFFHMCTLGRNAVITADEVMHPFLNQFAKGRAGIWLFEVPNLKPLERELNRFGYTLTASHHQFLPLEAPTTRDFSPLTAGHEFSVKWFYDREILPFYGDKRFPNAICERYTPTRPDRAVVCAYDGEQIMGMAGCSEDAPGWQQIGIDVMPGYRGLGVGTYLVTVLRKEIEQWGDIPFYGTSLSNLHSQNIARNCGFRPAWIEIGAEKIDPPVK